MPERSDGAAPDGVTVPLQVRIAFAHASVQYIAESCGSHVLHIKGAALDAALAGSRTYSDADVLVRPDHLARLLVGLSAHGWELLNSFAYGSSFEHSATFRHQHFGLLDLHRVFPGLGPTPDAAFEHLWAARATQVLGGVECAVPSLGAQALVMLLHAARSGGDAKAAQDVKRIWTDGSKEQREAVLESVRGLDADMPFAIITGGFDAYSGDPAWDLWRVAAYGGTRFEEWRARIRAARGPGNKLRVAMRSVLVNVEHLTIVRGRPVDRREVVAEFFARPIRGVREQHARRRRP